MNRYKQMPFPIRKISKIDPLFDTFKVAQSDFWKFFIGFIVFRSDTRRWAYHVLQMKGPLQ